MIQDASKINYKLLARVGGMPTKKKKAKIIRSNNVFDQDREENLRILELFRNDYYAMYDLRRRRRRARDFYRGKQWSDLIEVDGEAMTEEDYLKKQGKVPLKQNKIREAVKNILGQYRNNPSQTIVTARIRENQTIQEMMSNALQYAKQINDLDELDTRSLEEFLLSGTIIGKVNYKFFRERDIEDVYVSKVSLNNICHNTDLTDPRGNEIRRICEIIDLPIEELFEAFAVTRDQEKAIRKAYRDLTEEEYISNLNQVNGLSAVSKDNIDFYIPNDTSKARVYECWTLEYGRRTYIHDYADGSYTISDLTLKEVEALNQQRVQLGLKDGVPEEDILLMEAMEKPERYWYVRYLTPDGVCLYEGETMYEHQEHPYALHYYPLVDGEVWGFVEDVIDQQKYINRLIILLDFIISASAKGVLMVPEDSVPDDKQPDDFADEWTKFNGVIVYKPSSKHNQVPQQVSANSTNVGIQELLSLQMGYFQDVSGTHNAMLGKEAKSGTPSSLYAQQAQNASVNIMDVMMSFNKYKQKRDLKILKVIKQFYKEERLLNISGKEYEEEAKIYVPDKVQNIEFDTKVTQGQDTAVYRQLQDELLFKLYETQAIGAKLMLKHSSHPGADRILRDMQQAEEKVQNGQGDQGAPPPELIEAAKQGDPKAVEMLKQATGQPTRGQQGNAA